MKHITAKTLLSLLLPLLLVTGLVLCIVSYAAGATRQLQNAAPMQVDAWTRQEKELFDTAVSEQTQALKLLADALVSGGLDEADELCRGEGFSGIAAVYEEEIISLGGNDIPAYFEKELTAAAAEGNEGALLLRGDGESGCALALLVPAKVGEKNIRVVGLCDADALSGAFSGGTGDCAVFTADGCVIAYFGDGHKISPGDDLFSRLFVSEGASAFESTLKENGGQGVTQYRLGDHMEYAVYYPLEISGCYIMTMTDMSLLDSAVSEQTKNLRLSSAIALLLLLALLAVIIYWVMRRFRELKKEEERFLELVNVDELTGLYTKRGFESRARQALDIIPEDKCCAMVSFEIVAFRSFNALYGFDKGDELLSRIAEVARSYMKPNEVCGHLFADRFAWLMYGESIEEIKATLERAYYTIKETQLPFFLCSGVYEISDRGMLISSMMDKASVAKETVKGNFSLGIAVYDDSMLECQLEDAELVANMINGLNNGEFVDFYQAKYRTDSETVAGAEALVRWKKPNGEIIPPGRFIALFEKNGFIRKLDFYMLERVCLMLKERMEKNEELVPISVNFSRVHIYDSGFPETVREIVKKSGVPEKYIEIELTESAFFNETDALNDAVNRLHKYGFSVAIDDFGSGYSSLNMLKDVSVDVLKIDMRFLEGFERGGKVGTVVTSVVRMAKWLGIPVVAEGVETKEQVEFLRSLGCDMVQGYFFARPIARGDFEKLLNKAESTAPAKQTLPETITLDSLNAVLGGDSLLTSLMDGMVGGFGLYELSDNRLEAIRVNRRYYELMGYPDLASFSKASFNVIEQIYVADQLPLLNCCRAAVSKGTVQSFSVRRYNYSGKLMHIKGLIKRIGGSDEKPLLCITFLDATESLRAEQERELNKYSDALYSIYDEIYEFNFETNLFRLLSYNHVRRVFKTYALNTAEKKWLDKVVYSDDRLMIEGLIGELRNGTIKLPFSEEYRINTPKGVRWVTSSVVSVSGGSHLLCSLDITEKKRLEEFVASMEGLHHKMDLDMITGVLSTDTSDSFIRERFRLDDTSSISALMLFSIENFSGIVGKLGWTTANTLLKEAAQQIKGSFKEQDVVGRFEDDKFIVLMSGINTSSIAITKAIKAQSAVNDIKLPEGVIVDCCVGISLVTPLNRDYDNAVRNAQTALEQARKDSVNRCVLHEESELDP